MKALELLTNLGLSLLPRERSQHTRNTTKMLAAKPTETTSLMCDKPEAALAEHVRKKGVAVASCLAFMVCSASMMLVNKRVVQIFEAPVTILEMQLLFTVAVLCTFFFWDLKFGSKRDVWRWARAVPLLYAGMLSSSMIAQLYASVSLQVAIRNLGPLVTLPIERYFNEPIVADAWTWSSMIAILGGVMVYASEAFHKQNISELAAGIVLMLVNLLFGVTERLVQRRLIAIEPVDVSKTGMLLINNAGAFLPVGLLLLAEQEAPRWPQAFNSSRTTMDYLMLFFSGVCGIAIGWTGIKAQSYVTATTMLLITNLNKFVVVLVGVLFLGEPHGPLALTGMAITLLGGVAYAFARNNVADKMKREKEEQTATAVDEEKAQKAFMLQEDERRRKV